MLCFSSNLSSNIPRAFTIFVQQIYSTGGQGTNIPSNKLTQSIKGRAFPPPIPIPNPKRNHTLKHIKWFSNCRVHKTHDICQQCRFLGWLTESLIQQFLGRTQKFPSLTDILGDSDAGVPQATLILKGKSPLINWSYTCSRENPDMSPLFPEGKGECIRHALGHKLTTSQFQVSEAPSSLTWIARLEALDSHSNTTLESIFRVETGVPNFLKS